METLLQMETLFDKLSKLDAKSKKEDYVGDIEGLKDDIKIMQKREFDSFCWADDDSKSLNSSSESEESEESDTEDFPTEGGQWSLDDLNVSEDDILDNHVNWEDQKKCSWCKNWKITGWKCCCVCGEFEDTISRCRGGKSKKTTICLCVDCERDFMSRHEHSCTHCGRGKYKW